MAEYAVSSIEKFLQDNMQEGAVMIPPSVAVAILERAQRLSCNGVISGGDIDEVMGSEELAVAYDLVATTDPHHLSLAIQTMKEDSS